QSLDQKTWLSLGARNIAIAEELCHDMLTLCNVCCETLKTTNHELTHESNLKNEVNTILSQINREFKGDIKVRHIVEILYEDIGPEKIKEMVKQPLQNLKVAVHYGCHLIRPSEILAFDDPERPQSLDVLVEALGAKSIPYLKKMECCGTGIRSVDMDSALKMTRLKLIEMKRVSADCILTVCPFCFIQFDVGQFQIQKNFNEEYNIPVLYYMELLGLAMGLQPKELGLDMHRIKTKKLLERLFGSQG
ncbi:MAG: CoB--CoM heterodisulfide reductase iron-sulfur subunit B family protein, partial [Candidatus Sifarchaeia archaeon]